MELYIADSQVDVGSLLFVTNYLSEGTIVGAHHVSRNRAADAECRAQFVHGWVIFRLKLALDWKPSGGRMTIGHHHTAYSHVQT